MEEVFPVGKGRAMRQSLDQDLERIEHAYERDTTPSLQPSWARPKADSSRAGRTAAVAEPREKLPWMRDKEAKKEAKAKAADTPSWVTTKKEKADADTPSWTKKKEKADADTPSWTKKKEKADADTPSWVTKKKEKADADTPSWVTKKKEKADADTPSWSPHATPTPAEPARKATEEKDTPSWTSKRVSGGGAPACKVHKPTASGTKSSYVREEPAWATRGGGAPQLKPTSKPLKARATRTPGDSSWIQKKQALESFKPPPPPKVEDPSKNEAWSWSLW